VYSNDTNDAGDICSGHQNEIALVDCYNSSYVYYSIDFCDPGGAMQPHSPGPQPQMSMVGIVGGVLGGLAGLVAGCLAVFLVLKKKRGSETSVVVAAEETGMKEHNAEEYQPHELATGVTTYVEV
jgi:hypothetical protein